MKFQKKKTFGYLKSNARIIKKSFLNYFLSGKKMSLENYVPRKHTRYDMQLLIKSQFKIFLNHNRFYLFIYLVQF